MTAPITTAVIKPVNTHMRTDEEMTTVPGIRCPANCITSVRNKGAIIFLRTEILATRSTGSMFTWRFQVGLSQCVSLPQSPQGAGACATDDVRLR